MSASLGDASFHAGALTALMSGRTTATMGWFGARVHRIVEESAPVLRRIPLAPFGLRVEAHDARQRVASLPLAPLRAWLQKHRLVVLRGFAPLDAGELQTFGRTLGELQTSPAGGGCEADPCADRARSAWVDQEVPMHWDHVVGLSPRYLVFHCDAALPPGGGGESFFSDTTRVLAGAPFQERAAWTAVTLQYPSAAGTITQSLLDRHPLTGDAVLRYAEPTRAGERAHEERAGALFAGLRRRLYDPRVCYPHPWRDGDVLLADNHVLLHGRAPFAQGARRRVRRVNVL